MNNKNDFLFSMNREFLEDKFEEFLKNPDVEQDWQQIFADFIDPRVMQKIIQLHNNQPVAAHVSNNNFDAKFFHRIICMILQIQKNGYQSENINLLKPNPQHYYSIDDFKFSEEEKCQTLNLQGFFGMHEVTVQQIFDHMQQMFCNGRVHFDYNHIHNGEMIQWLNEKIEQGVPQYNIEEKKGFWHHLMEAESFEQFIHKKYVGAKRFSVEGSESYILAMEHLIHKAGSQQIKEINIGMAHRGRLNTLTKITGKPYSAIFHEFDGHPYFPREFNVQADVKYHMGFSTDRTIDGHTIHIAMQPNPSHLEAVNTVLLGSAYAKQIEANSPDIIPVLVHGDASFTGQGIVGEMLCMKEIEGYNCAGTIHIIINNQVGFTADINEVRSDPFPTNPVRSNEIPILHINGDDPEAVVWAIEIALEFRQKFKKSVMLNLIGYRRYGHNEGDEPRFTQPAMYAIIDQMPTIVKKYQQQLLNENCDADYFNNSKQKFHDFLQTELDYARDTENYQYPKAFFQGKWTDFRQNCFNWDVKTGVSKEILQSLAEKMYDFATYNINSKLQKILELRKKHIIEDNAFDWGTAENLAIASLINENVHVRISGQDVGRGTFAHRHGLLSNTEMDKKHVAFDKIQPGLCKIYNSPLSEYGVLGFEYGYSTASPRNLIIWEAQFGDFINGGQIIIDQFIASAEQKWLRCSNLVVSLPHGYEGQGPEHSSGRIERFLQMCANENMQIVNCSTPANYFHALRRQIHASYRKPLISFTPKSLLRHKMASSNLQDLSENFQPILVTPCVKPTKMLLCSGKVYYDLAEEIQKRSLNNIYIIRVEQLHPFPQEQLLQAFKNVKLNKKIDLIWCQEEPKNMGAWSYICEIFADHFVDHKIRYAGRKASAVTACGAVQHHKAQFEEFMNEVFIK